jgi:hypothetical protein
MLAEGLNHYVPEPAVFVNCAVVDVLDRVGELIGCEVEGGLGGELGASEVLEAGNAIPKWRMSASGGKGGAENDFGVE